MSEQRARSLMCVIDLVRLREILAEQCDHDPVLRRLVELLWRTPDDPTELLAMALRYQSKSLHDSINREIRLHMYVTTPPLIEGGWMGKP